MEDYAQIYWLDPRNADSRDHRAQGGSSGGWRPGPVIRPGATPPAVRYPAPAVYAPPGYPQPWVTQPVMQPVTVMQPGTILGGLTVGVIVDIAAQALAALAPLPAAPVATSDASTDVGNLILYQSAIAQHAKRDEQLRTLGSLISKLVR